MAWRLVLPLLLLVSILPCFCAECACGELEARVQELESENAKLLERLNGDVPYFSVKAVVDSLGAVSEAASNSAFSQVTYPTDLVESASSAVNTTMDTLLVAHEKAVDSAVSAWASAKKAAAEAAVMVMEAHGKHVEPHAREYYSTTADTYTTHVEPHLLTARKVYDESVHPHVEMAKEKFSTGVGAAMDGSKSLSFSQLRESITSARMTLLSNLDLSEKSYDLLKPMSFKILGRKFSFPHGWADVALAGLQAAVCAYVAFIATFLIIWKLWLKTILWKIGVRFLGQKIMLRIVSTVMKISYKLGIFAVYVAIVPVSTCFAIFLSLVFITACSSMGVGLFHAIEKSFTVGLSVSMRLMLGVASGLLFYLVSRCFLCKCKKKKADKKPSAPAKKDTAAAKKTNGEEKKSDAKQASKPAAKKK